MARITSKQAKELMEAYASVHNLQERVDLKSLDLSKANGGMSDEDYNALSSTQRNRIQNHIRHNSNKNTAKEVNLDTKSGEKVTVSNVNDEGKAKRVDTNNQSTSSNNNQQSTQSNNNKQSTPTKDTSQGQLDAKSTHNTGGVPQAAANIDKIASSGPGSGSVKVDGKALMNKLKADSGDRVQSSGNTPSPKQPTQEPGVKTSQTVVKDGNRTTTTTRRSADSSTPEGAAAVAKEKAAFKARREARTGGNTGSGGQPPSTQGGGQPPAQGAQQQRPGALSRLGSLAGRAVAGARNVASNVKQGAQAVAGGIKQGAQAVAGALANKGPIQGRASGPQRRAQQQAARPQPTAQPAARPQPTAQPAARPQPTAQPAARPVQAAPVAKPVPQAQPVAKPAAPQLSGAQRAQQMAKQRISQGRNTVTGALKSAKPKPKVTTWRELEGYDPMENLFDDTVQFLVSEGHAKDKSEAMSIMSESEFIDAFNQELNG